MFSAPFSALMLIVPLVSAERDPTCRNGALPPESITEAAISDDICSAPLLGVNQPSFPNQGELVSAMV
jgi:hypothetical protein